MRNKLKNYSKLFCQLIKTDLIIFKPTIINKLIDATIIVAVLTIIFAYIFPSLGMVKSFGSIYLVGIIASYCVFETFTHATIFISDLEGNKTVDYFLTLPLPSWLIFIKDAVTVSIKNMIISIFILPIGKLILWNRMDLTNFNFIKFILIFISMNFFYGFFTIFLSGAVKNLLNVGVIWRRFLFPLWIFGGSDYPIKILQKISPQFFYISLLNPLLYPVEGLRAAILGQSGYLNYWICLILICFFTIIFGFFSIKKLKKRLDFV